MIQNITTLQKHNTISITKKLHYFIFAALSLLIYSCKPTQKGIRNSTSTNKTIVINSEKSTRFSTGADNYKSYFSLLDNKRVGVITNQTGVVLFDSIFMIPNNDSITHAEGFETRRIHLVDYLLKNKINIQKIYAPEHGFRGIN